MLSGAGNAQVAATAVGFTTMFFIIVALAGALFMGYGRRSDGSQRPPGRDYRQPRVDSQFRSEAPYRGESQPRGQSQLLGGEAPYRGESPGRAENPFRGGTPARGMPLAPDGRPPREEKPPPSGFKAGGKYGVSHQADRVEVEVNPSKCARFGFCEHEAPDVFYLESDGRFGYQASVPIEKMEQVISAMDICPRRAIKVKLPKGHAEARIRPPEPPQDHRRTIIPIFGERTPEEGGRGPR